MGAIILREIMYNCLEGVFNNLESSFSETLGSFFIPLKKRVIVKATGYNSSSTKVFGERHSLEGILEENISDVSPPALHPAADIARKTPIRATIGNPLAINNKTLGRYTYTRLIIFNTGNITKMIYQG